MRRWTRAGLENVCETVDEDCAVTQWSTWSPCSVTCGEGTSRRLRYYLNKDDMVRCQRQTDETQTCRADVLDCDDARRAAQQTGTTGNEECLYSAILVRTHTLKALMQGSHSFACKQHHACLSFVSVHQMAPPQLRQQTSNCSFTTHVSAPKV